MSNNYPLSDAEREKAFPVHIELGDTPAELSISKVDGLDQLPDKGCALIEYTKEDDGEGGVTLTINTVCLPEDGGGESDENESEDLPSAMKSFAKDQGKTLPDDETDEG